MSGGGGGGNAAGGDASKKPHGFNAEVVPEHDEYEDDETFERKKVYLDPNRPDPFKRLYNDGREWKTIREKKLQKARDEKVKEELSQMAQPQTTEYAQNFARNNFDEFLQVQKQWEKQVEHGRIRETKKVLDEQAKEDKVNLAPWQMSGGSKEIMRLKQSLYSPPASERGYKKNLARYVRAKSGTREALRAPPSFSPSINPNSARMCRKLGAQHPQQPPPIHERLHALATDKDAINWEEVHEPTGTSSHTPRAAPPAHDDHEARSAERKGVPLELYQAKSRVRELAQALEHEHEKTRSFEVLAREVQREAEYLEDALKQERERNALLALELQHERAKSESLEIALKQQAAQAKTSRNIGEPLIAPSALVRECIANPQPLVSLTLSPRRCHPYANDANRQVGRGRSPVRSPSPAEINLDDL